MSSADVVSGPLTAALSKLSDPIDPVAALKTKGMMLRPEFYAQHKVNGIPIRNLDHTKLTFEELIFGMDSVLLHLMQTGGDTHSYCAHKVFLSGQARANKFTDQAYVDYDRYVIDKYLEGNSSNFPVGDMLGVAMHFHAGNLAVSRVRQTFNKSKKGRRNREEHDGGVPEGFPEDICYGFNYNKCTGSCSKNHVCRICRAKHKAVGCPESRSDKRDSQ